MSRRSTRRLAIALSRSSLDQSVRLQRIEMPAQRLIARLASSREVGRGCLGDLAERTKDLKAHRVSDHF
jgi:hypothetical protein